VFLSGAKFELFVSDPKSWGVLPFFSNLRLGGGSKAVGLQ
jgi:hypothetical protein